jgi:hypothetical protein
LLDGVCAHPVSERIDGDLALAGDSVHADERQHGAQRFGEVIKAGPLRAVADRRIAAELGSLEPRRRVELHELRAHRRLDASAAPGLVHPQAGALDLE